MRPTELQRLVRLLQRAILSLLVCLLGATGVGVLLDPVLGETGWGIIGFSLIGLGLGLYGLYRQVSQFGQ